MPKFGNADLIAPFSKCKTHYLTREEAQRVIETESVLERKTAFIIGFDTGARVGEMLKVRPEHFDFDKGTMLLWDSKKKGWKIIPLTQETLTAVKLYLNATKIKNVELFQVTERTLNNWMKWAIDRCGITPDPKKKIRWHTWRGTFVRLHWDRGEIWLQQITGDSPETLRKYYEEWNTADLIRLKKEGGNYYGKDKGKH